jgi:intracellular multiplication protein IcmD
MNYVNCTQKGQRWLSLFGLIAMILMVVYPSCVWATDPTPTGGTLGSFAANINTAIPAMTTLIASIGYLGGIGFAVAGIIKFKQHKDTPHQVTLGVPIVMILIAAALIFLPTIITSTGKTLTGNEAATMGSPDKGGNGKNIWDSTAPPPS